MIMEGLRRGLSLLLGMGPGGRGRFHRRVHLGIKKKTRRKES